MKKLTLFAFMLAGFFTQAQNNLTIEEATLAAQKGFGTKSIYGLQWRTANELTYIDASYKALVAKNTNNTTVENFVTTADLETAIAAATSEKVSLRSIPFDYHWENEKEFSFTHHGENDKYFVVYNIESKKVSKTIKFSSSSTEEIIATNKNFITYLNKNNVEIVFDNGEVLKVTNDPEHVINGSSNTHRNEFGIDRGMWISPDNKKILFYKKDERMVKNYPLIDFGARSAEEKLIKYPMAGMKSEEVSLHIYNIDTKTTTPLNIEGDKEQFLTMPTWAPNSETVYVGVLNRGQNHLKLQRYNAASGKLDKQLFEEKSKSYVEPNTPLKFLKDNEFIYVSEKDGYRQMYRYNTNGKQLNSYVYKDVLFKEFVDVSPKEIYYMGTANKGMDKLLYKVDLKSGKTIPVTKTSATHNVEMNKDKTWYYSQYTNFTTPNNISLNNINGKSTIELLNAPNPYEGKTVLPKVEMVTIKAADGKTNLNGRLLYPANFNENEKYPVMVYVYGGPHAQLVSNRFGGGAGGFDYYMAQQGFVVFTLDNRGSENRGHDFEHVIHKELGQNEMADQMKGIEFLKSKKFVNADKIGVYGWSFGGFMTTSLMLNYPDTFKVGVAGGPVIDWKWYEIMYGERYMDTPEENPEGYEKTSTLNKVKNLKGRLLMIHGAQDPVVVQQHSMEFIEKCIKEGKQVDYFLYPTHEHNVSGKDRVHLNAKIADYFITHLKNNLNNNLKKCISNDAFFIFNSWNQYIILEQKRYKEKKSIFSEFKNKTLLIVNTASKCGFTPQYEGLEKLYQQYKDQDFIILAFPCNQFNNQEPGDSASIKDNCLINYGVSFSVFEKVNVNGKNAHPLFKYLKKKLPGFIINSIKWNFTKFLIDGNGHPIKRFAPYTAPEKLTLTFLKNNILHRKDNV